MSKSEHAPVLYRLLSLFKHDSAFWHFFSFLLLVLLCFVFHFEDFLCFDFILLVQNGEFSYSQLVKISSDVQCIFFSYQIFFLCFFFFRNYQNIGFLNPRKKLLLLGDPESLTWKSLEQASSIRLRIRRKMLSSFSWTINHISNGTNQS